MKRIISVFLSVLIIFICNFAANAVSIFDVSSSDIDVKNNRLFDVPIFIKCNSNISAFTCDVSFDNSFIEFRGVSTNITDGMVEYNDNKTNAKFIFLCENGVACNGENEFVVLKFKSINTGSTEINVNTYDCVDVSGNSINVNVSAKSSISILGSQYSVVKNSKSSFKKNSEDKDNAKKDNKESGDKKSKKKTLSFIEDNLEKDEMYIMLIIFLVLIIVIGAAFVVIKINNMEERIKENKLDIGKISSIEENNDIDIKDANNDKE